MAILCLLGLLGAASVAPLFLWAHRDGSGTGNRVAVEWPPRLSASEVARELHRLGLIHSPKLMLLYLWITRSTARLEPGWHLLNDSASPSELVLRLRRHGSRPEIRVTLPEGWNHLEMARRLEERDICQSRAFVAGVRDPKLMAELGLDTSSAEGYLFPATYTLHVDTEPRSVVRMLVSEFRRRMARIQQEHPEALPAIAARAGWGEREVVVLASIIEKETAIATERPLIAGVYWNRLTRSDFEPKGRLQSDPTATYGCIIGGAQIPSCVGFDGRVTPAMLRDPANPYNTYRHPGLPPGPIANPGEASLKAALVPAPSEFLFFVANGDGSHKFNQTYEEHLRAIRGTKSH